MTSIAAGISFRNPAVQASASADGALSDRQLGGDRALGRPGGRDRVLAGQRDPRRAAAPPAKASSLYWGAWPAAHEARDPDYLFKEYPNNVDNLAVINRSKYRHVGHSFRGLVIAVLAYLLMLIVGSAGL